MLDIHTHLYWDSYDTDRGDVIARAHAAGVKQMLVVGTTIEESRKAITLAAGYDDVYASVGIHPNEFRGTNLQLTTYNRQQIQNWEEGLRQLAGHEKVVAIGECGLDYSESHGNITTTQKETQKKAFEKHIEIATELRLPLIVHCRPQNALTMDAYEDLYQILTHNTQHTTHNEKMLPQQGQESSVVSCQLLVILHCYMGDTEVTKKFLTLPNTYFSFTGNITYPVKKHLVATKDDLTETVKLIPKERIFVETDCPFLAPQQYRGKRNEPAYAIHTAEKVCELLDLTRDTLDEQLQVNFGKVFGKS